MPSERNRMHCCDLCNYVTKFPSFLQRHKLSHLQIHPFECVVCGSKFKTISAYHLHMREAHANDDHVCQECGAKFKRKRALERHMLCHNEEKPIACRQCGYKCRRKQDLKSHMRAMHSGKIRRKSHEEAVERIFYDLRITFTREFTVNVRTFASRKFARIDFHINKPWGWLLFEVDEMAHCTYNVSDECIRMHAIWQYLKARHPGMRLHIIRYNSHAYKEDGTVIKPSPTQRITSITESLSYVPETDFVITYLYYRRAGGRPAITLDPEYTLQDYVRTTPNLNVCSDPR